MFEFWSLNVSWKDNAYGSVMWMLLVAPRHPFPDRLRRFAGARRPAATPGMRRRTGASSMPPRMRCTGASSGCAGCRSTCSSTGCRGGCREPASRRNIAFAWAALAAGAIAWFGLAAGGRPTSAIAALPCERRAAGARHRPARAGAAPDRRLLSHRVWDRRAAEEAGTPFVALVGMLTAGAARRRDRLSERGGA